MLQHGINRKHNSDERGDSLVDARIVRHRAGEEALEKGFTADAGHIRPKAQCWGSNRQKQKYSFQPHSKVNHSNGII